MTFAIELEGDPRAIIRVLKLLLRRLGRDCGVRCRRVAPLLESTT